MNCACFVACYYNANMDVMGPVLDQIWMVIPMNICVEVSPLCTVRFVFKGSVAVYKG